MSQVQDQAQKQLKFKSIKVRKEVYDLIKSYAEKHGMSISTFIMNATMFYHQQTKKHRLKEDLPLIDKVSWYTVKVVKSFGAFYDNPSETNYKLLMKNLNDLSSRLGIDTTLQKQVVEEMYRKGRQNWDSDDKMEMNAAFKHLVIQLMFLVTKGE